MANDSGESETCPACDGSGVIEVDGTDSRGEHVSRTEDCTACDGDDCDDAEPDDVAYWRPTSGPSELLPWGGPVSGRLLMDPALVSSLTINVRSDEAVDAVFAALGPPDADGMLKPPTTDPPFDGKIWRDATLEKHGVLIMISGPHRLANVVSADDTNSLSLSPPAVRP